MLRPLLVLASVILCTVRATDRPVVGILTEPLNIEVAAKHGLTLSASEQNKTFIAASYVKYAEAAGARVVPIHYDAPEEELRSAFGKINGIIFPGGGVDINNVPGNTWRQSAELLYNLALEANDKGDFFPIHGTCLGFQLLLVMTAANDKVVCHEYKPGDKCFDSEGTPLPLEFTEAARTSRLFAAAPPSLMAALADENLTENSHGAGVFPKTMHEDQRLAEFYTVLSTNHDLKGRQFVSTIEAKKYPISATQWHPEKNAFEWGEKLGKYAIPHGSNAIKVTQYFADQFVDNARRSTHGFPSTANEEEALIWNTPVAKDPQGYYSQVYLWDGGYPGKKSPTSFAMQSDVVV